MPEATFPTADQAAHAIVAACRIVGVNPLDIEPRREGRTNRETILIAKARCYAAAALMARFACPKVSIGRIVGMGVSASTTMSILTRDISRGNLRWWRPDDLAAVEAAIPGVRPADDQPDDEPEAAPEPEEPVDLPPFLPPRPEPARQPTPAAAPPRAAPAPMPRCRPREAAVMSNKWSDTSYRQPAMTGKRAAYDLLREAVQNTAAMTPKE